MKVLAFILWGCTLGSLAHAQSAAPATEHAQLPSNASGVVNLNSASPEQLERLPGIGPAKAKAIVNLRRTHPFSRVDELTKVKGFGKRTVVKLRPYLTILGPTTLEHSLKRR